MVVLIEILQRICQKQSCGSSYSSNVRIDISKMYLTLQLFLRFLDCSFSHETVVHREL